MNISFVVFAFALLQHPAMPPGMTHEEHQAQMKDAELQRRGEASMGFDQQATAHHFLLRDDGGIIEVTVRRRGDAKNVDAVRRHLRALASDFAAGVFAKPIATHGEVPPGAAAMQRMKGSIRYVYEETADGGRVRVVATRPQVVAAIHEFLRYQIREHRTDGV